MDLAKLERNIERKKLFDRLASLRCSGGCFHPDDPNNLLERVQIEDGDELVGYYENGKREVFYEYELH